MKTEGLPGTTQIVTPPQDGSKSATTVCRTGETVVATSTYSELRFHDEGGLGEVFKADDHVLKREVALKFIQPKYGGDPTCLELFLTEAEITSRLDHPGVVPVYALGETADGRPFYAMRFVEGTRLKEEIDEFHKNGFQRRDLHRLLGHIVSVCNTVAYAHNRGIVHRDIKPENVMLGRFQETMLLDWGLALSVQRDERAKASGEKTMLIRRRGGDEKSSVTGAGTVGYMSPEQLPDSTAPIGPASDVYSLGATLYRLLAGKPAFKANQDSGLWDNIRYGRFPRPGEMNEKTPSALEAICMKAMATDPGQRYPGALELAADLQSWLADEPVSVYREPGVERAVRWARRHSKWALAGTLVVGTVLLATIVSAAFERRAANAERRASSAAEDGERAARDAQKTAEKARQDSMRMTARFAAKSVASDVDVYWRILSELAADAEVQQCLLDLEGKPPGSPEQQRLQNWLVRRKDEQHLETDSWFVNDAKGTQLARSPFNAESVNGNFSARDYFHGLGRELSAEEAVGAKPIRSVHRSAVYQSASSNNSLKVAFTVPVWKNNNPAGEPIGVLGASVVLGKFATLQTSLDNGQVAVLVDLRQDWIEGEPKAGLILHHPDLVRRRSQESDVKPFRINDERLKLLRILADLRLNGEGTLADRAIVSDYADPLSASPNSRLIAAFEPVIVESRPDETRNIGWILVVQEKAAIPASIP